MSKIYNQTEAQNSLLDFLIDSIPELQFLTSKNDKTSNPLERSLFSLWSDAESQISERKFVRPIDMTEDVIIQLESSGLIESIGKNIKVTSKGTQVIQKIILDEEKSIFEKSASSKPLVKVAAIIGRKKNTSWYQRLKS